MRQRLGGESIDTGDFIVGLGIGLPCLIHVVLHGTLLDLHAHDLQRRNVQPHFVLLPLEVG